MFSRVILSTEFQNSLRTDRSLGCFGFRGDTELSWAGLVFSCDPEDVGQAFQKTFNVELSVWDDVPEDQDRKASFRKPSQKKDFLVQF